MAPPPDRLQAQVGRLLVPAGRQLLRGGRIVALGLPGLVGGQLVGLGPLPGGEGPPQVGVGATSSASRRSTSPRRRDQAEMSRPGTPWIYEVQLGLHILPAVALASPPSGPWPSPIWPQSWFGPGTVPW